ncbi:MAG: thiamine-phosphate kinase [Hylemonella sp.]|uniref:thiamine-phosphate kinase n=1 Tax=Hylemonella sp. TaxID=2066020 RepID=UPI00391D2A99
MGEFELIRRYFQREDAARNPAVALGIGDDCALLQAAPGMQLAISSDMLVEGRHFFADVDPEALGHKALAVNLSDLAASGARPLAFTLALSLPQADEAWLAAFARGLFALADTHGCTLMGGDTTRGPLNLCLTVFGEVPAGQALLRSGGRPGDELWVSGTLGDARLALEVLQGRRALASQELARARQRLERPTPRVALGLALRGIASAAMDLSDGLAGDLGHLLQASGCGAELDATALSPLLAARDASLDEATRLGLVLGGGDDYELLFSAPVERQDAVQAAGRSAGVTLTRIGRLEAEPGLRLVDAQGRRLDGRYASYDHFA